jgi:competence protein ComEA
MQKFSVRILMALVWASLAWGASSAYAADSSGSRQAPVAKVQSALVEDKVNVNTASADALSELLTGIGPKKAEAIVTYRETNGPFKSVDDLLNVKGIGQATLEKNRHIISI